MRVYGDMENQMELLVMFFKSRFGLGVEALGLSACIPDKSMQDS